MVKPMNLQLNIPQQLEDQLRLHASAAGQNVESFILQAVESTLAGPPAAASSPPRPPREQWFSELKAWAESHPPVNHFVDDSRESIYPDRG
jgi:hypothetical protein